MRLSRRRVLQAGASVAGGASLSLVFTRTAKADFGKLVPDPNGVLDLPAGFTYRVLETAGADMSDGYLVPGRPDGMECFGGPQGTLVLMRNHELSPGAFGGPYKAGQSPPAEAYDAAALGGVTRVVVDANTFERVSSNLVLAGTTRNCAGGYSPWGWLTCEEDVSGTHGYVFLCSDRATKLEAPQKLAAYGRMNHEAATVDPETFIAYLTEDRADSCFYRFVPSDKAAPFVGKLQALKLVGKSQEDLGALGTVGLVGEVEWVDVDEPDSPADDLREKAQVKGASIVRRGEGIFFDAGSVYFCATSGGPAAGGQIFRLDVAKNELFLHGVSTDKAILDMPDNITVAPWGDVVMAEDGTSGNFLRGLTPTGEVYDLARNAKSTSELAGVCFSPDGKALFVNMQGDGLTLVVTGPFPPPIGTGSGATTSGGGGNAASSGAATTGVGAGGAGTSGAGTSGDSASEEGGCAIAASPRGAPGTGARGSEWTSVAAAAALAVARRAVGGESRSDEAPEGDERDA